MKFAKLVFGLAGVWGVLVFTALYFFFDYIGRCEPPALTHPLFYLGFLGLGLAWQAAFLVMAWDPRRFRPMTLSRLVVVRKRAIKRIEFWREIYRHIVAATSGLRVVHAAVIFGPFFVP